MAEGIARGRFDEDRVGLSEQLQPIMRRKGDSVLRQIANQARADVPVRTGNLGRTIGVDPMTPTGPFSAGGGVFAGGPQAPYAIPVHEGSRPHRITARRAPMLSFYWTKVGRHVKFFSVNHPGTKARPFLRNAALRVIASDPDIHE